jgi:methionyl-tRNA formyltransferase
MVVNLKIDILVDNPNSWFISYAKSLKSVLSKTNETRLIGSLDECVNGDILFILSCEKIIKKNVRDLYSYPLVVHASDLPRGKGWSPLSWQIVEGKKTIVLTMFLATSKVDDGPIVMKRALDFTGYELIDELRDLMGGVIINMCVAFAIEPNKFEQVHQFGEESFYSRRTALHSELDPDKTLREQFNILRVVDNDRYPAYFYINGHKFILKIEKGN